MKKNAAQLDAEIAVGAASLPSRGMTTTQIIAKLKAAGYQVRTSSRIGVRGLDNGAWEAVCVRARPTTHVVTAYGATRAEAVANLDEKVAR